MTGVLMIAIFACTQATTPGSGPDRGLEPVEMAPATLARGFEIEAPPHQDSTGGANQELLELAGGPAGFTALWRDERHAEPVLLVAGTAADGAGVSFERPIHGVERGRRSDASLAVGPRGAAAVVWFEEREGERQSFMRLTGQGPELSAIRLGHGTGPRVPPARRATGESGPSIQPNVALSADGSGLVAWREGAEVWAQPLLAGPLPGSAPMRINAADTAARGRPLVAVGASGALVAWSIDERVAAAVVARGATAVNVVDAGAGRALELTADGRGGYWLLLENAGRLAVRHLSKRGRRDRPDLQPLPDGLLAAVDIAVWNDVLLLAVEWRQGGPFELPPLPLQLWVLSAEGVPLMNPIAIASADERVRKPQVAASAAGALVAFSIDQGTHTDVVRRFVGPNAPLTPPTVWNTDIASSHQRRPVLASDGRRRALVAWEDARDGPERVRFRFVAERGDYVSEDLAVAEPDSGRVDVKQLGPVAALLDSGRTLVAWREQDGATARALARVFDARGKPFGKTFEVDPGRSLQAGLVLAATTTEVPKGFALLWIDDAGELVSRVLGPEGERRGERQIVASPDAELRQRFAQPAIAHAADGRLIAMWLVETKAKQPPKPTVAESPVQLRAFAQDLTPLSGIVDVQLGKDSSTDRRPRLAMNRNDGLHVLTTTGAPGAEQLRLADCNRLGRPQSLPKLIDVLSPPLDAAEAVALREDLVIVASSGLGDASEVLALRVDRRGRVGHPRRVHSLDAAFRQARTRPSAAVLGERVLVAFEDRRRARGMDIGLVLLDPRFDDPRDLPPAARALAEAPQLTPPTPPEKPQRRTGD